MSCLTFTTDSFDIDIDSDIPVVVDFWASWCMPCKMISPLLDKLATDYDGKAKIGKVNIDNDSALATRLGISSIPTILIFHNNKQVHKFIGIQPESVYKKAIDDLLQK